MKNDIVLIGVLNRGIGNFIGIGDTSRYRLKKSEIRIGSQNPDT